MTTDQGTPEPLGTPQWVTIAEAAELLDVTPKTVRRKIKAGELVAEMRHDPEIGQERWFVDSQRLPRPPGTAGVIVPLEVLERIEELHKALADARAEAAKAQTVAEFQSERREAVEAERDAARAAVEQLRTELAEAQRPWWRRKPKPPSEDRDEKTP